MEPTLHVGQTFTVVPVEAADLKRGDLIVYEMPTGEAQVKHLVGLPGETVEIRDGQVFIDGELLVETYPLKIGLPNDMPSVVLGADEYFVLGDNRPNSRDSRIVGPVKAEAIIGKGITTWWNRWLSWCCE